MRRDGVELQVVGVRVRAPCGGGRHGFGGGAGVQPDAVQHATGYSAEHVQDDIHVRPEAIPRARDCTVPHHPELQGLGRAGRGGRVSAPEPRREVHRRGGPHGGPSSAAQLARPHHPGTAAPYTT